MLDDDNDDDYDDDQPRSELNVLFKNVHNTKIKKSRQSESGIVMWIAKHWMVRVDE